MAESAKRRLHSIYQRMEGHYGPTGWWPGETPFEVAVGAILTQNTAWTNVEKAIANLKAGGLLSPTAILSAETADLETALRPSGYFRVKAQRLRHFCTFLMESHGGDMARLAAAPLPALRRSLLGVHCIGPETADDIILYACGQPVFVVDAYTRRILSRHGMVAPTIGYEELRSFLEQRLAHDVSLFQEYHALIVLTAKDFCRATPKCEGCPLEPLLKANQPVLS